ncbi:M14 family zinc carboxypeptidase [Winogradskyella sp. 3972H.M.0a.05]|uniref:M14 family zinc carboxypeptidase n=1 Tax=Winogradskyella sp. 3972H.M.0a.05 TaxID=2950277 RepID=UPI003396D75B
MKITYPLVRSLFIGALLFVTNVSLSQTTSLEKAQNFINLKGEVTFDFQVSGREALGPISHQMSIVNFDPTTNTVKVWANQQQFEQFLTQGIPFQVSDFDNVSGVLQEPQTEELPDVAFDAQANTLTFPITSYPTYADYAQQMQDFANDNPGICEFVNLGATAEGDKDILFVKLSDNVTTNEQEPRLLYTSSMHGDEIAGYPMMLELINYLITAYNDTGHAEHARVQALLNNSEIWINPNANPDGTYYNDPTNTSVANARRANHNNIDLNRNYPDNVAGAHPDGEAYQPETILFMDLADDYHFVMSANFHGGVEVVNYPWDNTFTRHADDAWYQFISREYADNCQGSGAPMGYFDYLDNGITNGADWYRVEGGRQDYMNYYHQCKETTVELSDQKTPPANQLDDFWNYNREALIDYLEQGTYGFRGVVKDATSGNPIEATITLVGHDNNGSHTISELPHGDFYRPTIAGTYDILIEATCYQPVTLPSQAISNYSVVDLGDVLLTSVASQVPTGLAASNVSSFSADMSWGAIASANYDIRYKPTSSGSWTEVTGLTTNSEGLTGLTDTTEYEVQVRTNCGSSVSAYSSSVTFTTTAPAPCTGTLITSYPYVETFDSGIGDWVQGSGDDGNWTLDASGTPTNNTGPSNDITGGGNYFYTEANGAGLGNNNTAYLESPCFDLTSASNPYFTFYHHMYGSAMGTLTLEVSVDDGSNWSSLFSQNGNQGNQWNTESIDISAYVGQTVKFRFTGLTGGGNRSDMAIDQIRVGTPLYCASNGNNTNDEYISRVQLSSIDNSSGVGTSGTGYSDFTSTASTDLDVGTQYTITITPTWPGTPYDEGYSVWIDYNADGDFNDAGEQVFTQAPTQTNPVSGNFTVPASAKFGTTRMRVSLKYNGIPTACEQPFNYGEVEDYAINITYDGLLYMNNAWTPYAPSGSTGSENVLIMNGSCSISSDIMLNNMTVESGASVEVDKTASISLGGNLVNNGNIILNSDSDEYSSLIVTGTVTGNARYLRHVNANAGGNDLIAPPVSGEAFNSFITNNSNILSNPGNTQFLFGPFDKATSNYLLYSNTETATLDAGTGYRAASTDNSTFSFNGTVSTGNVNIPILDSGSSFAKWNLIGNPYTSYVSLADFLTANNTQLDGSSAGVYGYDGDASNGWTIWNQAFSDANPGSLIAPGQGFFVASTSGGGTIGFTPSMRSTGTSDDFIIGREGIVGNISYLKLNLDNTTNTHNTEFYFSDNASLGLDPGYDAMSFGGTAPSFGIYSHLVQDGGGTDMAVQAVGNIDINNSVVIPLGINAAQGQQLTVSIAQTTLDQNVDVYLEDNLTNTFTLLNEGDYVFTPDTNLDGTGRFFLRFEPEALSTNENSFDALEIYTTSKPKQLIIKGQLQQDTNLNLYDVQGRLIISKALDYSSINNAVNMTSVDDGVYIVELVNKTQSKSTKVIIR